MAERLVVGFDGKLDAKNAEEGPARMAVAITRDLAAGEGIVLLQDSNAECDLVWHYERTHMHHQHAHLCGQETKGYELISKTTLTYSTEAAARDQNTLGWGISLLSESMRVRR